jgi:surface-anchored protein
MKTQLQVALIVAGALSAQAQVIIANGHVDIGIGYHDGHLDLHVHQEEPVEMEYEPDEVLFRIGNEAFSVSPGGSYAGFLGPAGSPIWVVSASEQEGVPFLGFGTEELDAEDWLGNISLTLTSVSGPGDFSLWNVNAFGVPNLILSSVEGSGAPNSLSLIPGSHAHFNLGFTAPGTYGLTFEASGTHMTDGFVTGGPATYTFEVVPEPSTWALLGLGTVALGWMASRRKR